MSNLKFLSEDELHVATVRLARAEQELTLKTIRHIQEINRRYIYAKRGYSSINEYVIQDLGYSKRAASERVAAMRLLDAVPSADQMIEKGELCLSTAVDVQRFMNREEKAISRRLTPSEKKEIVSEVSGQSCLDVEKTLLTLSSCPETH